MTGLHQDFGDSGCVRTSVTVWGSWGGGAGSAVADVGHSWCGWGVLGEDLAVEVGGDDLVAGLVGVGDDEDLLERVLDADLVEDLVHVDDAGAADLSEACVGGQVGRRLRPGTPSRADDGPV